MGQLRTRKRGTTWEWSFEGARINGKRNSISKADTALRRKLWLPEHRQRRSMIMPDPTLYHLRYLYRISISFGWKNIAKQISK